MSGFGVVGEEVDCLLLTQRGTVGITTCLASADFSISRLIDGLSSSIDSFAAQMVGWCSAVAVQCSKHQD